MCLLLKLACLTDWCSSHAFLALMTFPTKMSAITSSLPECSQIKMFEVEDSWKGADGLRSYGSGPGNSVKLSACLAVMESNQQPNGPNSVYPCIVCASSTYPPQQFHA